MLKSYVTLEAPLKRQQCIRLIFWCLPLSPVNNRNGRIILLSVDPASPISSKRYRNVLSGHTPDFWVVPTNYVSRIRCIRILFEKPSYRLADTLRSFGTSRCNALFQALPHQDRVNCVGDLLNQCCLRHTSLCSCGGVIVGPISEQPPNLRPVPVSGPFENVCDFLRAVCPEELLKQLPGLLRVFHSGPILPQKIPGQAPNSFPKGEGNRPRAWSPPSAAS